jgi:hypothetical protein
MKSMMCKDLGGPCEELIYGSTPDEMMKSGEEHLNAMSAKGDAAHMKAKKMMEDMQMKPMEMKKWNEDFVLKFNGLPEE